MCISLGNYGRGFKPPSPYELSNWILAEEEKQTNTFVEEVKRTWPHTGVTIMSDGWKDVSMQDAKESLDTMFSCREWQGSSWSKNTTGKEVKNIIRSNNFWKGLDYAIKTTKPLVNVLRMADSEKVPGMGFLYGAMDRAKKEIAENLDDNRSAYNEIWKIIDDKWDHQMHRHLHAAAYYLNPHFHFDDDFSKAPEIMTGLYTCFEKLIANPNDRLQANLQLDKFRQSLGLFGFRDAKATRKLRAPADWWNAFGDDTPELKSFAVRVLSLTASASGCERNWSTFNQIHTKRRNRLTTQKLNTLAYIMYNKKLKEKHLKNIQLKEDEDPLVHDCCPSDDEWVVPEPENLALNVPMLLQNEHDIDETYGNSSEQSLKRKKQQSSVATGKGKKRMELVDEDIHDVDSSSSDTDDGDGDDEGEYRPHTYFNSDFYSSFVPLDTDDTLLN